ncbi:MAG: SirB2 family protein [Idiomarina sp.]|nr:SirB2 family protein [Idiomarina sp.]
MDWYFPVKNLHMATAVFTVTLLLLRLGLDVINRPGWRNTLLKRLPHVNDTLLLASAIFLLVVTGWNPFQHFWLGVKLLLVVGYIVTGWFALRLTMRARFRAMAAILALVQMCVIFVLATTKPML